MPYPRFQRARSHKFFYRSAGDLTISSTTFAAVDTGIDITLDVQAGDTLEIGVQSQWGSQAVFGRLRAVTVVGSTVTSQTFGDGTNGNPAWLGPTGTFTGIGGSLMYVAQTADISSGAVKVRLEARVDTATPKTLVSSTASPLHFWVKNIGPVDPN